VRLFAYHNWQFKTSQQTYHAYYCINETSLKNVEFNVGYSITMGLTVKPRYTEVSGEASMIRYNETFGIVRYLYITKLGPGQKYWHTTKIILLILSKSYDAKNRYDQKSHDQKFICYNQSLFYNFIPWQNFGIKRLVAHVKILHQTSAMV